MESLSDLLRKWNKSTSERMKLQQVYVFIIIVMTIIAGLAALVNANLGHRLIIVSGIALVAFLANALVWALTRVYVVGVIERNKPNKK